MDMERDSITGLKTREGFFRELTRLFEERDLQPAVLLIEVHRFKNINDGIGLLIGDRVIRRIGERLKASAPSDALIGRMGGDGFAVAVEEGGSIEALADTVLDIGRRPIAVEGHVVMVEMSIGIAKSPEDGTNAVDIVHAADIALHNVQCNRVNSVLRYDKSMKENAQASMSIENDLRYSMTMVEPDLLKAVATEQFEIHYQPLVQTNDHALLGFEALLRWRHPHRGLVGPDIFIPLAEEIGLMDLLGSWVIRKACKDIAQLRDDFPHNEMIVSVNVSPKQFDQPNYLIKQIELALSDSGLPAQALQIEVTENTIFHNLDDILSRIKQTGCLLALDDFGTGYSSLNLLRTQPFDSAKLDKSFVQGIFDPKNQDAASNEVMIKAFRAVCDSLTIKSVVEGIETEPQDRLLKDLGADYLQGFFFSKPMPLEKCPDFLSTRQP